MKKKYDSSIGTIYKLVSPVKIALLILRPYLLLIGNIINGLTDPKITRPTFLLIFLINLTVGIQTAYAQNFLRCSDASISELVENIETHSVHTRRMDEKFLKINYGEGTSCSEDNCANLEDITRFVKLLRPRKAGVIFYAYERASKKLCVWLITQDEVECNVSNGNVEDLKFDLPAGSYDSIDESNLQSMSKNLLSECLTNKLADGHIDTLIVVPIFSIGSIPFSALPVKDKRVVDFASVTVAPGFDVFKEDPERWSPNFLNSVIAGNPDYPSGSLFDLPRLGGTEDEAKAIAGLVNNEPPLIGRDARIAEIKGRIESMQESIGLIYLGTHGSADRTNPLDSSLLFFSDGVWSARDIHKLPLQKSRPLVVLSACQSGLGKDFEVGTIGMTRAWHRAGASSVVMSLWSIADLAAPQLVIRFIRASRRDPPDIALQKAMLRTKSGNSNPVFWAGFTVFGVPHKLD